MTRTVAYACTDCATVQGSIANEQATLDPRFAIGYCGTCQATRTHRVDIRSSETVYPKPEPPQPIVDTPPPEPDFPTRPDPNSRGMARGFTRSGRLARLRRRIVSDVAQDPGMLGCSDWCIPADTWGGHGPVSGALSHLWQAGVLVRDRRKRSKLGGREWAYRLAAPLADDDAWADVDWRQSLDVVAERFGLG